MTRYGYAYLWLPTLQMHGASYCIHYFNLKIRLSDATGKLTLTKLDGPISKSKLDEKDGRKQSYYITALHYSSLAHQCSLWTQASRCLSGLVKKLVQLRKRMLCPMPMYVPIFLQ